MRRGLLILLLLLTLLTASIWLLPSISPAYTGAGALIGLSAIPVCLFNALVALVLMACRLPYRGWSLLLLIASLPLISYTWRMPRLLPSSQPSAATALRIISWNADGFQLNADTLQAAARFLSQLNPDIICLQERPHTNLLAWDTIRQAFAAYPYTVINTREDEVLNLAILSRYPLTEPEEYYFADSYNKAQYTDLTINQQTIRLYNVHLQTTGLSDANTNPLPAVIHNARLRAEQAQQLAASVSKSPYPVILCGDFNDVPWSYPYRHLSANLTDAFLQSGSGWGATWQRFGDLFRIDYLLCSKYIQTHHYQLFANDWSDHKIQFTELISR